MSVFLRSSLLLCTCTVLLTTLAACGSGHAEEPSRVGTEPILNLSAIAGKSPNEVEQVLGKPTEAAQTRPVEGQRYPEFQYRNGSVNVVYIDGKADWIFLSLHDRQGSLVELSDDVLAALGLPRAEPIEVMGVNGGILRWTNYAGYREIVAVAHPTGGAAGVHIAIKTPLPGTE